MVEGGRQPLARRISVALDFGPVRRHATHASRLLPRTVRSGCLNFLRTEQRLAAGSNSSRAVPACWRRKTGALQRDVCPPATVAQDFLVMLSSGCYRKAAHLDHVFQLQPRCQFSRANPLAIAALLPSCCAGR